MAITKEDKYANVFQVTMQESAATTLTFGEMDMGLTIFQKVGIVISRIEVDWTMALFQGLVGDGDAMQIAITQSNQITSLGLTQNAVVWKAQIGTRVSGTPAVLLYEDITRAYDLSQIPGGGLFIAPRPLYWGIQGSSIAGTYAVTMRFYFTIIELKPEEYFELLESRRFFG